MLYLLAPLNANLRYEAGVKIAGTDSAAATFSHRPLAYRLIMDAVFRLADLVSTGVISFEMVVRILLAGLAVGSGVLLWKGLARHQVRQPGLSAVVVVGALIMRGMISVGEPDWLAVVFTAAGIGVALLDGRQPWIPAVLAGVLFVAASGVKIVSLPVAVIGLVVVLIISRRLAGRALVATLAVGVLYVLATLLWVPWEIQWLLDIRAVQNSAVETIGDAGPFFAALVADAPVLALLPAALVLTGRRERAVVAGSTAVTAGLVVAQGQYFAYHAIPRVVVAAVAVFRALRGRVSPAVGTGVLLVVLATSALSSLSSAWQISNERLWTGGLIVVAIVAVGWAVAVRARSVNPGRTGAAVAALATLALLLPGATPWSAQLLRAENADGKRPPTTFQIRDARIATAAEVHQVVGGPKTPVVYLTSGEWTYWLTNPTNCRYPSPLFLQRTRKDARLGTASYRENVACLADPDGRWLVVETSWFITSRQPDDVKAALDREWECNERLLVDNLQLCPRRR